MNTSSNFQPVASGTQTFFTSGNYEDWNLLAAAATALIRYDLNTTDEAVRGVSDDCPGGAGCCVATSAHHSDYWFYVSEATWDFDRKYQTAHEVGHLLLRAGSGFGGGNDDSAVPGTCFGGAAALGGQDHHFISEEYQAEAFWEGFANYYAVAAFNNDTSETDCVYGAYKRINWDLDADTEDQQFIDCAGDPTIVDGFSESPTTFVVTGTDFFDTYCTVAPNRGLEYDWVSFVWHLDAEESMSPDDIASIFAAARQDGPWYATDDDFPDQIPTGLDENPAYELGQAALDVDLTFGEAWMGAASTYGVAH